MINVIAIALQDYKRNKRAIKRLDDKIYLSVDLEETIELMAKKSELIGENKAIIKYIADEESNVYTFTDLEPDYIKRLFEESINDDKK